MNVNPELKTVDLYHQCFNKRNIPWKKN